MVWLARLWPVAFLSRLASRSSKRTILAPRTVTPVVSFILYSITYPRISDPRIPRLISQTWVRARHYSHGGPSLNYQAHIVRTRMPVTPFTASDPNWPVTLSLGSWLRKPSFSLHRQANTVTPLLRLALYAILWTCYIIHPFSLTLAIILCCCKVEMAEAFGTRMPRSCGSNRFQTAKSE